MIIVAYTILTAGCLLLGLRNGLITLGLAADAFGALVLTGQNTSSRKLRSFTDGFGRRISEQYRNIEAAMSKLTRNGELAYYPKGDKFENSDLNFPTGSYCGEALPALAYAEARDRPLTDKPDREIAALLRVLGSSSAEEDIKYAWMLINGDQEGEYSDSVGDSIVVVGFEEDSTYGWSYTRLSRIRYEAEAKLEKIITRFAALSLLSGFLMQIVAQFI